jgi:hypothetical protein
VDIHTISNNVNCSACQLANLPSGSGCVIHLAVKIRPQTVRASNLMENASEGAEGPLVNDANDFRHVCSGVKILNEEDRTVVWQSLAKND